MRVFACVSYMCTCVKLHAFACSTLMGQAFTCFACGKTQRRPTRAQLSFDNFEFLSICAENSLYGTPRSTPEKTGALPLFGTMVNGIRYHPYSVHFGYPGMSEKPTTGTTGNTFDFSVQDELERELVCWVTTKCSDGVIPVLVCLHPSIQARICSIIALTDEEQVVEPMRLLESLRVDLSGDGDSKIFSYFANLSEQERYLGLDFLVLDQTIQRLRWKYPRIRNVFGLMATVPLETEWNYEQCSGHIDVWTRIEDDGSFSVRCQSVQEQPLFNAISLIYEVDLHPSFMPHLHKATKIGMIQGCGKRAQILARYIYQMPIPFANRDTVLFAFGCNAMQLDGINGITICAQSIPSEDSHWWGHPVPVEGSDRMVRETIRGMSFVMRPVANGRTEMTVIANLDKQVAFVPQSLINWMIKDMIKGLYRNMVKINLKFPQTEFAKRVAANPEFYDWVKLTLAKQKIQ